MKKIIILTVLLTSSFNSFSQGVGSDLYSILKTYETFGIDTIRLSYEVLVATFKDDSGVTTFTFDRNNICKTLLIDPATKESLEFNIKVFDTNYQKLEVDHWINYGTAFNVHVYLRTMKSGKKYFELTK